MKITELQTARLKIRRFSMKDVPVRQRISHECFDADTSMDDETQHTEWAMANYHQLEKLRQPPYGDYAITLPEDNRRIGSIGLVPALIPWSVFPEIRAEHETNHMLVSPEFGLFWAILPEYQGKSYATEAAGTMINHVFEEINAKQVIATTEFDNAASQRVMQKLNMTLLKNPGKEPHWCQVVGLLINPEFTGHV